MSIKLIKLTCNYQENPISLNVKNPLFSWIIIGDKRGIIQKAYRIIVSESKQNIEKSIGDIWDTDWMESDKSINIIYKGKVLQSDTKYYWSAAIKENNGNISDFSRTYSFTTAFFNQTDWHSSYIGTENEPQTSWPDTIGTLRAPIYRREYDIKKTIKSARAYFSGLGWGELYINGNKIGESVLDPGPTDYRFSIPYVVYDVSNQLIQGKNAIGIMVGNGWFSEYRWYYAYGITPKAMLQINIIYEDGEKETLYTDKGWKTSHSPILENRWWGGEYYDARLEQEGWTLPGFNDANWAEAVIKNRSSGIMKAQEMPSVKVMNTIEPIEIKSDVNDECCKRVFDMKILFGGWSRITVRGVTGQKVNIRYSDRLDADGYVDQSFQNSSESSEEYSNIAVFKPCTDTYVLRGSGIEVYEPRFTLHPVQYVQVEYDDSQVEFISIEGRQLYQDVDFTTCFNCSNELLNKIHNAVMQAIKNQTFGLPLDCLNREHWGWVDPASIAGTFYPRQFMPLYWKKWAEDIRESQFPNGGIPDIAPLYFQDNSYVDPIWGGSFARLVWFYYKYYDDQSILRDNYNSIKKLYEYHGMHKKDGILTEGTYGDHMIPGDSPGKEIFVSTETSTEFLWTGWYYECARILSEMAEVLNKEEESRHYKELAQETYQKINDEWFDADTGIYDNGSQTSQYYALAAGFVPDEHRDRVLNKALADLEVKYHGNHHTGNTGTTAMIDILGDMGHADILYKMINKTSYPGWGYMIDNGATAVWESWSTDNLAGCELSMTMYTTVDEFFYNELAGIKGPGYFGDSLFDKPGFKNSIISPLIPDDMEYAGADMRTVYGRLVSKWEKKDNAINIYITIPANTTAAVKMPFKSNSIIYENEAVVWSNGQYNEGTHGIYDACFSDNKICFKIGSGSYKFTVKGN